MHCFIIVFPFGGENDMLKKNKREEKILTLEVY